MLNKKITLNVHELSNYLNISESSVRKMVKNNKIPFFKVFSKILFNKDKIDQWISASGTEEFNQKED